MYRLPKYIQSAIEELGRLPGVGPKSAGRLAFWLLNQPKEQVEKFTDSIAELPDKLAICNRCRNYSDGDLCEICVDTARGRDKLCVVESPFDVIALEKTGFNGNYFILGGLISPLDDIGPNEINLPQLVSRVSNDQTVEEVILATAPSLEGEATANYIAKLLKPTKVKITRIAQGVSFGSELEYADEITLRHALDDRKNIS